MTAWLHRLRARSAPRRVTLGPGSARGPMPNRLRSALAVLKASVERLLTRIRGHVHDIDPVGCCRIRPPPRLNGRFCSFSAVHFSADVQFGRACTFSQSRCVISAFRAEIQPPLRLRRGPHPDSGRPLEARGFAVAGGSVWGHRADLCMGGAADSLVATAPVGLGQPPGLNRPSSDSPKACPALRPTPSHLQLGQTIAVSRVEWSGPDIPTSEHTYTYALAGTATEWLDQTTITKPRTIEVLSFCGERAAAQAEDDALGCGGRVGSMEKVEIFDRVGQAQGALLRAVENTWSLPLITDQFRPVTFLPNAFLQPRFRHLYQRDIIQQGITFRTQWTNLEPSTYRPQLTTESFNGDLNHARQSVATFSVDKPNWIIRALTEKIVDLQVTGPTGRTFVAGDNGVSRVLNADGQPTSVTGNGKTDMFSYQANGLVGAYTEYGGGGAFTINAYAGHVPTSITQQGTGATLTRTLSGARYIASETDWEGHTTSYTYDDLGRMLTLNTPKTTDADFVFTYDFTLRQNSQSRGTVSVITRFDSLGRVIEVDRNGIVVRTEYDALGRTVFVSDPYDVNATALPSPCVDPAVANYCTTASCNGTCTVYDGLDRPVSRTYTRDQSTTTYAYPTALQDVVTNPLGQVTTTTHERFGNPDEDRPVLIEQEEGVVTEVAYYRNGEVVQIVQNAGDAFEGPGRTSILNEDYQLVEEVHPDAPFRTLTYDNRDRVNRVSGGVRAADHSYDDADRTLWYGVQFLSSERVDTTYDDNHRVLTQTLNGVVRSLTYDPNGNVLTESTTVDGRTFTITRTYDAQDALTSIEYPSGRVVSFAPDALGRPTQAAPYVTSISHTAHGTLDRMTYANGHTVVFTPDGDRPHLIGRIAGGPVDLDYGYDAVGNTLTVTDGAVPANNITLGYDDLNRLTSATGPWETESYTYDVKNNLQTKTINGAQQTLTYGYERQAPSGYYLHQLETADGVKQWDLHYDNDGQVSSARQVFGEERRQDDFLRDFRGYVTRHTHNEMERFFNPSTNTIQEVLMSQGFSRFAYDGEGNRVRTHDPKNRPHYTIYSDGLLLYDENHRQEILTETVYVGRLGVVEVKEDCAGASSGQPWCEFFDSQPEVAIVEPQELHTITHRDTLQVRGVAWDAEAGDVSSTIRWELELNQLGIQGKTAPHIALGTGAALTVGPFPVGIHRLEAIGGSHFTAESTSIRIEVIAGPNEAPIAVVGPQSVSATGGLELVVGPFTSWFSDPDGDTLSWVFTDRPAWLVPDGDTLRGTPPFVAGPVVFTVAADDSADVSEAVTVTVNVSVGPIKWTGTPGNDVYTAGPFDDTLDGLAGHDQLWGADGNDTIYGREGNDTLYGGPGADTIHGHEGGDSIRGDAGNDTLYGGSNNDFMYGGVDHDQLFGEEGNDVLRGEDGDDVLEGGLGNDSYIGGPGDDTYVYRDGAGRDTTTENNPLGVDEIDFADYQPADISVQHMRPADNVGLSNPDTERTVVRSTATGDEIFQIGQCRTSHCTGVNTTEIDAVRFADDCAPRRRRKEAAMAN